MIFLKYAVFIWLLFTAALVNILIIGELKDKLTNLLFLLIAPAFGAVFNALLFILFENIYFTFFLIGKG